MGKFLNTLASLDMRLSVKRSSKRMNATKQSDSTDGLFQYETRRTSIVIITTIHYSGAIGHRGMRTTGDNSSEEEQGLVCINLECMTQQSI